MMRRATVCTAGPGCLLALVYLTIGSVSAAAAAEWTWPFDAPGLQPRARIGLEIQPMTPELRQHFKAPADSGLLVARVQTEGAAAAAGVVVGDVVVRAAGEPLQHPFDLLRVVERIPEGEELSLEILRDGRPLTIAVRPRGAAHPWLDPDHWQQWLEDGLSRGSESLRQQLRRLEERLEKLERELEEERKKAPSEQQT